MLPSKLSEYDWKGRIHAFRKKLARTGLPFARKSGIVHTIRMDCSRRHQNASKISFRIQMSHTPSLTPIGFVVSKARQDDCCMKKDSGWNGPMPANVH